MKKFFISILCICLLFTVGYIGIKPRKTIIAEVVKVDSRSVVLLDADSGNVLYSHNENARYPIASMVKIMSLLLTFEDIEAGRLNLSDEITVSENAAGMGGSQVFLDANSTYKADDLIKAIVISSANDATVAIAETLAGSEQEFVVRMNSKAKELGLTNTNFANSTGLPAPEGYSSAKDVATAFSKLINYPQYFEFSKIYLDTLKHPSGRETQLANTNKLVRFYDGCDGGKTGSTNEAKFCLCATAKRSDLRLISCVIGAENSKTRNAQVSSLLNYGFNGFVNKKIVDTSYIIDVPVLKANSKTIKVKPAENFSKLSKKGEKSDVTVKEVIFDNIKAPLKQGDKLGEIIITDSGEVVKVINLIATENVGLIKYANSIKNVIENWGV